MALAIVVYHFCFFQLFTITSTQLPGKGYLAADFFFILSGFVLSHVYMEGLSQGTVHPYDFYIKRLARIYPVHLFTFLISVLLTVAFLLLVRYMDPAIDPTMPAFFSDICPIGPCLANLLLIHAWGWQRTIVYYFNGPSWSISAEWFAYLLFPMLVTCLRRAKGVPLLIFSIALFLAASLLTDHLWNQPLTEATTNFGLWRIMPEFLGGMAVYRIGREYRLEYCGHRVLAAFAIATILLMHFGAPDQLIILFFGVLIFVAAEQSRRGLGGWLTSPVSVYLGQISYSLYMLHLILIQNFFMGWPRIVGDPTNTPVMFYSLYGLTAALCLPAAALCYHFVEQPSRGLMTRVLLRSNAELSRAGNKNAELEAWTLFKSKLHNTFAKLPEVGVACAPYAALIIAVLLAYANVYHNEFVFDDLAITDNIFLTSWRYIGTLFVTHVSQGAGHHDVPFYRPLMLLLYMVVYQLAGLSTVAFHFLNITLHALNACLIYTLGIRLGFKRIAALLAALLWALHPVQTEAVTYMTCTADLLCGLFMIGGILILTPAFTRRRIAAACALFVMALLSKETSVVFPLLAMGLLFYQSENRWSLRTYLKTWPFWLITALYLLARVTVLNFGFFGGNLFHNAATDDVTRLDRFYTCLATLPTYLRLLVWPTGLHMSRSFQIFMTFWAPPVLAGFAVLAAAFTIVVWKPTRRASPLAWGLLWAASMHIPQSGILMKADAPIFEHWLYLPTMGLALGIGESLARLSEHGQLRRIQPALAGLAVLVACLFGAMTFEQNKVWRDPIAFYTHILDSGEDQAVLHNNLASAYGNKGEYLLAIQQYKLSMAFPDYHANAPYNIGIALIRLAQERAMLKLDQDPTTVPESIKYFNLALERDPDFFLAYDAIADVYGHIGDHQKESEYRAKAAEFRKKLGIE